MAFQPDTSDHVKKGNLFGQVRKDKPLAWKAIFIFIVSIMEQNDSEEFKTLLKEVQTSKDILIELQNFIRNEFILFREQLYDQKERLSEIEEKN